MADMNVDRAWLDDSSLTPYCVDEVLPAPDNFRLLHERFKQTKLQRREFDAMPVAKHPNLRTVQQQVAIGQNNSRGIRSRDIASVFLEKSQQKKGIERRVQDQIETFIDLMSSIDATPVQYNQRETWNPFPKVKKLGKLSLAAVPYQDTRIPFGADLGSRQIFEL